MLIIDSQSVKTIYASEAVGYDAGKKVKGRKRHIMVDVEGNMVTAEVHAADISDTAGAKLLIDNIKTNNAKKDKSTIRLKKILADGGYKKSCVEYAKEQLDVVMEVVKRNQLKEFKVIPKRWIVERSFAWLNGYRRLAKDYEKTIASAKAFLLFANIKRLLKSLTNTT